MLAHRDASHALCDLARRSQAVAIGPRACDGATQVASTCGDIHLAGSHPHAEKAGLALAASHGRPTIAHRRR